MLNVELEILNDYFLFFIEDGTTKIIKLEII
jgi:hypothetical protein